MVKKHSNMKKSMKVITLVTTLAIAFSTLSSVVVNGSELYKASQVTVEQTHIEENTNLIQNSDFSDVNAEATGNWTGSNPQDWSLWIPSNITTTDYKAEVNEEGLLVLESLVDTFRGAVNQTFSIESNQAYNLSFDIATENKEGLSRIRIVEKKDGQNLHNNHWFSRNFHSDTELQTVTQLFKTSEGVDSVTVELFFENGTGTVFFDNVELTPTELTEEEVQDVVLEETISIHENRIYTTNKAEYDYSIVDTQIAVNESGMIYPVSVGETEVNVSDETGEIVATIPLTVQSYEETIYDDMLNEWNGVIAGNDYYNPDNAEMARTNAELDATVEEIISEYLENINHKDYLWSDITDYKISPSLTTSYRRLETVAKQVTQPASAYYQDPVAIRLVRTSLDWLYDNVYNEDAYIVGNWWDYEIGTPRAINNTLSLMNDYFARAEIIKYTNPINKFVPDPYNFRVSLGNPFPALGGNLIDMGRVRIIASTLREDEASLNEAITAMRQAFSYAEPGGVGFHKDGSYIDHDNVALTGAYGNVMIDGLSQLMPVVMPTGLLTDEDLTVLYDFIDRSFLPLMYKGEMMDMTRGRSITREALQGHAAGGEVIRGMLRVADASAQEVSIRLNSIIKMHISADTYYDIYNSLSSYKDIALMDDLLGSENITTTALKNSLTMFNVMDKYVYHSVDHDFALGFSLYSDVTQNYEFMNGENARGWYTADGAVYLYNSDLSHYSDNYWATVNPYHIPGTTIVLDERADGSGQVTMPNDFVGGTNLDNTTGTIAMDFVNWDETLAAKKSWFVLDDKVVFLGSEITNDSEQSAITTIENRKILNEQPYEVIVDGVRYADLMEDAALNNVTSVLFNHPSNSKLNIGYVFLEESNLKLNQETRSGSWQDVNAGQDETVHTNDFVTLYQEHDNQETYAYVMYPNATNAVFKEKLRESEVIVLQNDGSVQSIYDGTINSWGVVLYEDQSFSVDDYFTVNKKGVYSIKKEKNRYVVSYYNPVEETYIKDTIESPHGHEVVKEASEADMNTVIHVTIDQEKDDHPSNRNNRHNGDHKDNNSGHNGNRPGNNSGHNGNNGQNGNKGNNGKGNRP